MKLPPPRPNLFEALALDRAAHFREQPEWLRAAWPQARVILIDFQGRARLRREPLGLATRSGSELAVELPAEGCFLGLREGQPWFAVLDQGDAPDIDRSGLREIAAQLDAFDAGLFAYAKAVLLWQSRARFCGACGSATRIERAGHCRVCTNPDCGLEHYPRTDAAIITLVRDGDRVLIGRGATWPEKRFSTLAGFVEPGESLEDALRREVFEESGVRVGACEYRSSQPWPFPASLMLGFYAEATDPTITLGDELAEARWVGAEEMLADVAAGELLLPFPVSVSFRLIADWLIARLGEARVRAVVPLA